MKSVRISSSLSVVFQLLRLSFSFGFFGLAERRRSKQRCAAKRVPYTAKSNLASTRSSYPLLKAGTLAAHRVNRLMLLGSPSDMIHSSWLRKTRPSTQQICLIRKGSALKCGIHPCIADFRFRAPLPPRLVWPSFTAQLRFFIYLFKILYYYNRKVAKFQGLFEIFFLCDFANSCKVTKKPFKRGMRRNFTPVKFALSEHPTTPSPLENLPNPAPAAQQDNSFYKKQIISVLTATSDNRVGVCVRGFQKGERNRNLSPFVAFFGYFLQLLAESIIKEYFTHSKAYRLSLSNQSFS